MKSRLLPLFLVLPMTLWAAGPDPSPPSPFCAAVAALPAPVAKDETPLSATDCAESLEPHARALQKANGVIMPVSARVVLQAPAPLEESERVRFEFDVYFHLFDANLSVQGRDKIDSAVERLNATWRANRSRSWGGRIPSRRPGRSSAWPAGVSITWSTTCEPPACRPT
jgi:hypothetical protein